MWGKSVLRENFGSDCVTIDRSKKKNRSVHKFRLDNAAYNRNVKITGCIKWSALHVKSRGSDMMPFIMSGHGFVNQMIGIVQSVQMEQDFQC